MTGAHSIVNDGEAGNWALNDAAEPAIHRKARREFGIAEGQRAARLCALNVLAHLDSAVNGELARVRRCVRIAGFVNSTPDFTSQSQVINGASDFFLEVFEEAGRHTRMAVRVSALPKCPAPRRSR
ncbi:MAG: RidA family protein [Acidobacteria bacterium]|nr:RidA family protein [Acidobacteriota bacterium]MCA1612413.1 RidA family protein [Acidobacteriota bacterium]